MQEPVLLALADLQAQWPQALQLHAHRLHTLVATGAATAGLPRQAAAAASAGVHRCLAHMGCGSLLRDLQIPMHGMHELQYGRGATGTPGSEYSTQHAAGLGLAAAAAAARSVGAWDTLPVRAFLDCSVHSATPGASPMAGAHQSYPVVLA